IVGTIGGGLPCTPGWSAGGPFNVGVGGVRSVGVFFPANGKFYAMGGRASDAVGSDFTNPFEYDTTANTWTTKSATYTDNSVNNMACGVLNLSGTDYIYCVGGSFATGTTATARVFYYDPVADSLTYLAGASDFSGGLVIDTTNSFSFDPVANTIGTIALIPRATGETRALTFKNPPQMWVMGGGRVAPNPSNEVDVYDPVSDSWSL